MHSRGPLPIQLLNAALLLALACTICPLSSAQSDKEKTEANFFELLPFDQWASEGPREQMHWSTSASYVGLSNHQRLVAHFEISVDGHELTRRGFKGQIIALVKVIDSAGNTYLDDNKVELNTLKPEAKHFDYVQSWDAFVLPGEYRVEMALYHTETKEHNFGKHKLRVPQLKDDRLPDVWHGLPAVEFWAPLERQDVDTMFRPDIDGRLHLPLATGRPVHLELLADVSPSDLFRGSESRYDRYLHALIPTVKTFSQIDVGGGDLDVALLDIVQKRVTFEQRVVKNLNWPRLKEALKETAPGMVSVQSLQTRDPRPVFLRDELARRIHFESSTRHDDPLLVFIIIGSPLSDYSFANVESGSLPEECHCRVYYLEYDPYFGRYGFSAVTHVKRMLRPMKIEAFSVGSAEETRNVLAKILKEIAAL